MKNLTTKTELKNWADYAFKADLPSVSYNMINFALKYTPDESIEKFADWLFGEDRNYDNPDEEAVQILNDGNQKFEEHFEITQTTIKAMDDASITHGFTQVDADWDTGENPEYTEAIESMAKIYDIPDMYLNFFRLDNNIFVLFENTELVAIITTAIYNND